MHFKSILGIFYSASRALASLAALMATALLLSAPVSAQGIERLGDFGDWSAFKFFEDGNPACYMASQPIKDEGDYTRRGDIYALVTHRPAESRRDEVSFVAGYDFKSDSTVEVTIGSLKKQLFTQGDSAWAADKETDGELVKAMIRGSRMIVKGTSSRGTGTVDTYSLSGFTKAHRAIGDACQ
ncbi:MAG: invasion associated locus B family protein [Pseudomonadota bacterium]